MECESGCSFLFTRMIQLLIISFLLNYIPEIICLSNLIYDIMLISDKIQLKPDT